MSRALLAYDEARNAIERARTIDEAKKIADQAAAMKHYARPRRDPEMMRWLDQIRLRACRRLGELSRELETHERARTDLRPTAGMQTKRAALKAAGLSPSAAQRYEQLAEKVSDQDFEAARAAWLAR